jgi:diguanylate cyclase (GGDEF)-like protein/PAS domain S-box-containing protein
MEKSQKNLQETYSRQVIQFGFALVIIIIAFVVIFGLGRLSRVHETLQNIVNHEQIAIEMLFRMQETARERIVLLYRMASTKNLLEFRDYRMQHGELGNVFTQANQTISEISLDEIERTQLAEISEHDLAIRKLQDQALLSLAEGRSREARNILDKQAVVTQNKLQASLNGMLEYEMKISHKNAQLLHRQQGQTRLLMLSGGGVAVVFVIIIAIFVSRRLGKLIAGLKLSASKLQEANLSLESFRLAMDRHNIVSISDVKGDITFVNDLFCEVSRYSREELIGKNHRIIKSGVHPASVFDDMWLTISSGKVWQGEVCNRRKDGIYYWVSSTIVPFLDDSGLPYQYISVRTDITAIKEAEQVLMRSKSELEKLVHERTADLEEREELLQSITTAAQDAVIMIDSNGNVTHWNPAAEKMFGYSLGEIFGRNLHSLVVPSRYLDAHHAAFPKFIQTGAGALIGAVTEVDAQKRDGSEFPIEISIAAIRVKNNWHAVAIVRDITIRKLADDRLKEMASTDPLTGAFNRRRFNEVMQTEIARAKRYGTPITLIIFDIDHFKRINDTYGHSAGDQVLRKLASLVSGNIRDTDIFARWGGEEFVILATNCDTHSLVGLAEKIRKLIEACMFDEVDKVTCSFGVTGYLAGDDQESIVKRADSNLYRAKETGRNRVCVDEV